MQECVSEFVSFLTSEYPLTVQVLLYILLSVVQVLLYITIGTTVHPQLSNLDYPILFYSIQFTKACNLHEFHYILQDGAIL